MDPVYGYLRAWWPDAAIAAALALVTVWMVARGTAIPGEGADLPAPPLAPAPEPGPTWLRGLLTLVMTVPLAGRRKWPLACLTVQFAGMLAYPDTVNAAMLVALVIGAYSLAVHGRSVPLSIGTLAVLATVTALVKEDTWPELPGWSGAFAILLTIGLVGTAIRAARSRASAFVQRAQALEREQHAATQLAVAQERGRIARELHDVVSHHVSVMTIQAGAAGTVLDTDPEAARGALSAIEASGRETMAELRHLLGALAPSDEGLLEPQPGLDQLDTLVENVRRTGVPVTVRVEPVDLPRGVDLAAYRVVQEAMTNALRHAPGAAIEVTIAGGDSLDIEVRNAAPAAAPAAAGSGTGLLGLAERLRLYGGTLEAGQRAGGGFRVSARIPLEPS